MDIDIPDDIVVLGAEPLPHTTVEQLKNELSEHQDENFLAYIYAGVSNEVHWLMGNLDDDICDPEAERKFHHWEAFETALLSSIFEILQKEPDWVKHWANQGNTGYYWKIMPFMERNGFSGKGGWWIPERT